MKTVERINNTAKIVKKIFILYDEYFLRGFSSKSEKATCSDGNKLYRPVILTFNVSKVESEVEEG